MSLFFLVSFQKALRKVKLFKTGLKGKKKNPFLKRRAAHIYNMGSVYTHNRLRNILFIHFSTIETYPIGIS